MVEVLLVVDVLVVVLVVEVEVLVVEVEVLVVEVGGDVVVDAVLVDVVFGEAFV